MRKRIAIQTAVLIVVLAAPLAVMAIPRAVVFSGHTLCLFKLTTGWDCPGCGMTRAVWSALHGDLRAAVRYNRMVVLVLPVLCGCWARYVLTRGRQLAQLLRETAVC